MASYSVTVAVPADDAGRFLDAAAEVAGDELTMNGISFAVADPAAVDRPAARARRGRRPGQGRGAGRGRRLRRSGPVISIVEGGGGGAVPVFKGGARMAAMAAPIEAGSETLSLQVTVTYELVPR